jgi:hypothetical protein
MTNTISKMKCKRYSKTTKDENNNGGTSIKPKVWYSNGNTKTTLSGKIAVTKPLLLLELIYIS